GRARGRAGADRGGGRVRGPDADAAAVLRGLAGRAGGDESEVFRGEAGVEGAGGVVRELLGVANMGHRSEAPIPRSGIMQLLFGRLVQFACGRSRVTWTRPLPLPRRTWRAPCRSGCFARASRSR